MTLYSEITIPQLKKISRTVGGNNASVYAACFNRHLPIWNAQLRFLRLRQRRILQAGNPGFFGLRVNMKGKVLRFMQQAFLA